MENKIFVTRPDMPDFESYCEILRDIWQTRQLTNMGFYHQKFQAALREFLNVPNVELFTNGHMALELSLQAFNFPAGAEVITTPFTFASTTHAIVRNGLTPVFCDINAENYTIDAAQIENLITEKTCAIMPVHVYGNICDVDEISRIAKKYRLKIIYDAAHTFGETYRGKSVAEFGDVSCYSFHATKTFHTIEGGCACFSDKNLGVKLYHLKNFGIRDAEHVDGIGANAKMNEFCAAMGLCNLKNVDAGILKRRAVFNRYVENLSGAADLKLNFVQEGLSANYSYFPVLFNEKMRDKIFADLFNEGIVARKYFYPLTNEFECFEGRFDVSKTPTALKISRQVLTLPIYADLPLEVVDKICGIILGRSA